MPSGTLSLEYDFEADFHPNAEVIVGQAVSLMVHKEKYDGTYNPTKAERKCHKFIMTFEDTNISRPVISDTTVAMDGMLGHVVHMHRAEELYATFNHKTNIGNVHPDLFYSDEAY